MKSLTPELSKHSKDPYYIQLYSYIRDEITSGSICDGERMPSLRSISSELKISVTTAKQAYDQLTVEGYISPKAGSGYYVNDIGGIGMYSKEREETVYEAGKEKLPAVYDLACFDFNKWKKCSSRIYTEYSQLLLFEGDPQGEYQLRYEIAKYVYNARGVIARPEQIVIGAGTQQITVQLARLLKALEIGHVAVEDPGYLPVRNIFSDNGFAMTLVPVRKDGILIEKLPENISCAAYVNPSNQFPTGAVMPVGKRKDLLKWAACNNSYVIEDDYDSELRYFGRPVPAMQGMDVSGRVIYLGSFSSTLFPAIKISYMILPEHAARVFDTIKMNYTQTCSKAEQLTLALFMNEGLYQTNIKKLRKLYAQKLQKVISSVASYGNGTVSAKNTSSGINIILSSDNAVKIIEKGKEMGLSISPMQGDSDKAILYYNQIPLDRIESTIKELIRG